MIPLVDGFGRRHTYLRIALTDRCNLRCVYCMPAGGVALRPRAEILTLEEIVRVAGIAVAQGVEKIRLTGGEPTVRHDVEWLVSRLAALPGLKQLAMTTNGVLLADKAQALKAAGLQAVNISLDSLRRERFQEITLRDRLQDVLAGITAALAAGFETVKLNVVVMAGMNDDELPDFVEFVRAQPIHVRFIEFMPFAGNGWQREKFLPWTEMKRRIEHSGFEFRISSFPQTSPTPPMNGGESETISPHPMGGFKGGLDTEQSTARDFHIPGIQGTISFITPLSDDFCLACNRLRLTADGAIKSCLLRAGEVNLRDPLRAGASDAELEALIRRALASKDFAHPAPGELPGLENRSMIKIGG